MMLSLTNRYVCYLFSCCVSFASCSDATDLINDSIEYDKNESVTENIISINCECEKIWSGIMPIQYISSADEITTTDDRVKVKTTSSENIQTLYVLDDVGDIIYLNHGIFQNNCDIKFDPKSTALALIATHPIINAKTESDLMQLTNILNGSDYYNRLEESVTQNIRKYHRLMGDDSSGLRQIITCVIDEIESEMTGSTYMVDGGYRSSDMTMDNAEKGISNISGIDVAPFYVYESSGKVLIRNFARSPLYEAKMYHYDELNYIFTIPSGDDIGLLYALGWENGAKDTELDFNNLSEGEYRLYFNKSGVESCKDLVRHALINLIEISGIPLDHFQIFEIASELVNLAASQLPDLFILSLSEISGRDVMAIASKIFVGAMTTEIFYDLLKKAGFKSMAKESIKAICKNVLKIWTIYEGARGLLNLIARLQVNSGLPDSFNFGLFWYKNELTCATTVELSYVSGNNQMGDYGEFLRDPITVKTITTSDNGNICEKMKYHIVKFIPDEYGQVTNSEIVVDDNNKASTKWRLGESEASYQTLTAQVYDAVNGKPVSSVIKVHAYTEESLFELSTVLDGSLSVGDVIDVDGFVSAVSTQGVVITDSKGSVFCYRLKTDEEIKLGDQIEIRNAKVSSYNLGWQIDFGSYDNKYADVNIIGNFSYPLPTVQINSASDFINTASRENTYLSIPAHYSGRIEKTGYYCNIDVGSVQISLHGLPQYVFDNLKDGQTVDIDGFVIGVANKGKVVVFIVRHINGIDIETIEGLDK